MSRRFRDAVRRYRTPGTVFHKDPYYARAIAHTFSDYGFDDGKYVKICKWLGVRPPANGSSISHGSIGSYLGWRGQGEL